MKKQFIKMLPMITAAMLATACDKNDEPTAPVQTDVQTGVQTQNFASLRITATKGADNTLSKALKLNGDKIDATWKKGDKVSVYLWGEKIGELTAQSDGESTTLSGELKNTAHYSLNADDKLTLIFNETDYCGQNGTLENIANKFDCAKAIVTVKEVTEDNQITINEENADFVNQQAIVKFTLKSGDDDINAKYITVNGCSITPQNPTNQFYAAIPGGDNVTITAYDGTNYYSYTKSDAGLKNGEYYIITVSSLEPKTKNTIDLALIGNDIVIPDGSIVSGKLAGNYKITIVPNATVTLKGAIINGTNNSAYKWAGITCEGNATIILEGENTVTGFYDDYPGIFIPNGSTLTIDGDDDGSLNASSNGSHGEGAGIGGGYCMECGNIVIKGGTITATGTTGIGCANYNCGNITINGGTINATGDAYGAGIGAGAFNASGSCGNITITGGTITATGGYSGTGIGGCCDGSCGNITITGGTITATGNGSCPGIGNGCEDHYSSSCGDITITSGVTKLTVTKGEYSPNSIGAGNSGTCGTVTVFGNVGAITESPYIYPTLM